MKDDDLDDRLARLRVEQGDPGQGSRQGVISRAAALWERYSRRRRRGDALLVTSAVLIAGVLIAALCVLVVSLASGGGEKPAAAVGVRSTPTALRQASSSATAPATEAIARPPVRQDCDAIRGTSYQSGAERAFYQQNCLEPEEAAPATNAGELPRQPASVPPAVQPTPAPPLAGGSDANVIGLAVEWILHHGSPSYTTDSGSCNAVQASGHWVVTCTARLSGCQGSVCEAIVSVCVLSESTAVRPSDQC
jgi:hypothetical protein